jgi:hypothetical protein
MIAVDPDHVDVVARQYHESECRPLLVDRQGHLKLLHEENDRIFARSLLLGLRNAGYTLTSVEGT